MLLTPPCTNATPGPMAGGVPSPSRRRAPRLLLALLAVIGVTPARAAEFTGTVVDHASGEVIPARVYLRDESGRWLFVDSAAEEGSAIPYREQWVPMPDSVEIHTTISAHPFRAELPEGKYLIRIERGKEYHPLEESFEVGADPIERTFRLIRWARLDERGWYSGETHVHRRLHELPNVMQAEDLNVTFPVTFWTTRSDRAPDLAPSPLRSQGPSPFGPRRDVGHEPIEFDDRRVIYPRNTEYEIFHVGDRPHTLGAMFLLNHRTPFRQVVPPVGPVVRQAREEGALIDLDKHSWPWSMMLVPVARPDLFELSNNSVWRTSFGFRGVTGPLPPWADFESDGPGLLTEWGWLRYGFEVYYGLLNCGFRMAPSAGTASGVHPVPLGFGRVYVHLGDQFEGDRWVAGLRSGRSFVTTGPMLFATVDGQLPGATLEVDPGEHATVTVEVESLSSRPVQSIEVILNGECIEARSPQLTETEEGAWRATFRIEVPVTTSGWIAVRSEEPQEDGRRRFAHTAPWYLSVADRPLVPPRVQVEYFTSLVEAEIARNRDILADDAMEEYRAALEFWQQLPRR